MSSASVPVEAILYNWPDSDSACTRQIEHNFIHSW